MEWVGDLEMPKPPSPDRFGLSDEDVERIERLPDRGVWPGVVLAVAWLVGLVLYGDEDVGLILVSSIVMIPFLIFFGSMLFAIFEDIWRDLFTNSYKEYGQLVKAKKGYPKKISSYFDVKLSLLGIGDHLADESDRHKANHDLIRRYGRVLSDVAERKVFAASEDLLRNPKSVVRSALLDEILAARVCEVHEDLPALENVLIQSALFQQLDRSLVSDGISDITDAAQEATRKGIDIPAESIIKALAESITDDDIAMRQEIQKKVADEQSEIADLLKDLPVLAAQIREHDGNRVQMYRQYFS